MKAKITILFFLLLCNCFAQNGINYKAVIKDSNGNIVNNTLIQVQFAILQGSTTVYVENHSPSTDVNGIIVVNIGEGVPVSGTFSTIDWTIDPYFLNVKVDTGTGLIDLGDTAFKSVPFAFHSKTAVTAENGLPQGVLGDLLMHDGTDWVSLPLGTLGQVLTMSENGPVWSNLQVSAAVGDYRDGGVVFWVNPLDRNHGLICAVTDQSTDAKWGCPGIYSGAIGLEIGTGESNTIAIESECIEEGTAADICANLNLNGYSDWFLPSINELVEMYFNRSIIEAQALNNGGTAFDNNEGYWSSSSGDDEYLDYNLSYIVFFAGISGTVLKDEMHRVRAVRAF